ncbi:hypothetical protein HY968_00395 [Candidatus Kaiserbacteria bacterium]|nr:hypothetical protein [Candidatus Kaiserbacteria bacterium]
MAEAMERGEVERDPYTPESIRIFTLQQCRNKAQEIPGSRDFLTVPVLAKALGATETEIYESAFYHPHIIDVMTEHAKTTMRNYNIFRSAYGDLRHAGYKNISRQMLADESGLYKNVISNLLAGTDIPHLFGIITPGPTGRKLR